MKGITSERELPVSKAMKIRVALSLMAVFILGLCVSVDAKPVRKSGKSGKSGKSAKHAEETQESEKAGELFGRANRRAMAGDHAGALKDFDELLRIYPNNSLFFAERAHVHALLHQREQALNDCRKAEELGGKSVLVLGRVAQARSCARDNEGAIVAYTRASDQASPQTKAFLGRLYTGRGDVYARLRNSKAAAADFAKAIEISPQFGYRERARARTDARNWQGAIEDLTECIKLNPDDAELYRERGTAKFVLKDAVGAIDDFDRAIQIKPDYACALARRADVRVRLKDKAGAMKDFDRAIELEPDNAITYVGRAIGRAEFDDRKGALEDFEKSLQIYENSSVYLCRADYKAKWGDLKGAIADYTKVLEYRPRDANVFKERGQVRLRVGDLAGAQSDLANAAKYAIKETFEPPLVF